MWPKHSLNGLFLFICLKIIHGEVDNGKLQPLYGIQIMKIAVLEPHTFIKSFDTTALKYEKLI